jgi:enoyl-[acyl-carrier protein] reductase I
MAGAKAALEADVREFACALGKYGVRFNSLSAGPIATYAARMIPKFRMGNDAWNERSPIGWDVNANRWGVAEMVAVMLSDSSRLMTGQVVKVDGGCSMTLFFDPEERTLD